jgi:hypothetical protein
MQYVIVRDRSEHIVLKVEEGKAKIFQRIGNSLRSNAIFLTQDEAIILAKVILRELQRGES